MEGKAEKHWHSTLVLFISKHLTYQFAPPPHMRRLVKLFKSSLEPPYVSLLVATKHEMAQRLFNTRFQLSFSTLLKPDGRNGTRPLLLGRSSGSDMVLDYRTVSARHATIRFKNGDFLFTDAGSSNGSYLYLRRPVELSSSQSVQFRLGRSMISMKVVNKWNRRLLRAVSRRAGLGISSNHSSAICVENDDHSVGSNEDDVRITDSNGQVTRILPRRTRENIMASMPPLGTLLQNSPQHLDLLCALAHPNKVVTSDSKEVPKPEKLMPLQMGHLSGSMEGYDCDGKVDEEDEEVRGGDEAHQQKAIQVVALLQCPIGDVLGSVNDMDLKEKEEDQKKH